MAVLKGVIFNINGTLVDSNRSHARAWLKAFKHWNLAVTQEKLRTLIGLLPEQLVRKVLGSADYHYSKIFQIIETHDKIFMQDEISLVRPLAGARPLIQKLSLANIPVTTTDSGSSPELNILLEKAAVLEYFQYEADLARAARGPRQIISSNTEALELASFRLGVEPTEAVFIGASPYDVEAAQRVNMPCIALKSGGWSHDELRGAKAIYDDLEDLWFRFSSSYLRETYLSFKTAIPARGGRTANGAMPVKGQPWGASY